MGGIKCCQELQRLNPNVRILLASGASQAEQIRESLGFPPGRFVRKPYRIREMLACIRETLDAA
jgi:hypothetical protein